MNTLMMAIAMNSKHWSKATLDSFKVEYDKAVESRRVVFEFAGNKYDQNFARYLIEYLEGQFKDNDDGKN